MSSIWLVGAVKAGVVVIAEAGGLADPLPLQSAKNEAIARTINSGFMQPPSWLRSLSCLRAAQPRVRFSLNQHG